MNMIIIKTIKIRSYEMGLYFRDRRVQGLAAAKAATGSSTRWARSRSMSSRSASRGCVAREARRDRPFGCAEGPRRGAGPEGLRAGFGLDRRPLQPRPAAGPVRLLDGSARREGRSGRCPQGALRAPGPAGHRAVAAGRARAGAGDGASRTTWACCSSTATTSRRCRRAATPSGRTWPRSSSSRRTCARRCSTWPARTS